MRGAGSQVIASVRSPDDASALTSHSGMKFAGNQLVITQSDAIGDVTMSPQSFGKPVNHVSRTGTIEILEKFMTDRFSAETKMLDLSSIAEDATLKNFGIVPNTSTSSKFLQALIKLISDKKLDVMSITLAGNKLRDVTNITTLAQYCPNLRNLSLANNDMRRYKDLDAWSSKNKLANLQELELTGNPVREEEVAKGREIEYRSEITKRFPSLTILDRQAIAQGIVFDIGVDPQSNAGRVELPVAIKGAFYQDETIQATAANFLGQFFPAYDNDRSNLATFYAGDAIFSVSVNTSAPRKKSSGAFVSQNWANYIHTSRNLNRITALDQQVTRSNVGIQQIVQALKHLPASSHDLSDASLFCVDAWLFRTSEGHAHVQICVHGEFKENPSQSKQVTKRSFDRTFILSPAAQGQGINGVVIKSDLFVVRAWGGHDAWQMPTPAGAVVPSTTSTTLPPQVDRPPELNDQQFEMLKQLMTQTGLNMRYAGLCLQQMEWNLNAAVQRTLDLKSSNALPPDAYT